MKITINDFILAEMSGPVGVRDFKIVNDRLIEPAQFLRAEAGKFYDRKNRTTTVTFSVTRLHATLQDAELFLLTHESAMPRAGLVTFTARSDADEELSRYLADALVSVAEATYTGVASRHFYKITGGLLLTAPPA